MRTSTSFGFSRDRTSQPSPHFSSAPGRKFSTTMCALRARRRTISWPSGRRRLQVTDFLLRDCTCHQSDVPFRMRRHLRRGSPSPGGSILITSAPKSASVLAQNGPAMRLPSSSTRIPVKGPDMQARLCSERPRHAELEAVVVRAGDSGRSPQPGADHEPGAPGALLAKVQAALDLAHGAVVRLDVVVSGLQLELEGI